MKKAHSNFSNGYDLPDPPGNPEFERYDVAFRNKVGARFDRGIALGRLRDKEALKELIRVSRSKESFG